MNTQIFGKSKCFDTKKAERYFKERNIKYQFVDIVKYGISNGEYQNVKASIGNIHGLIDEKSQEYEKHHIRHLSRQDSIEERLLSNPTLFKTPIVRNGKKATIGYQPDIWKTWD